MIRSQLLRLLLKYFTGWPQITARDGLTCGAVAIVGAATPHDGERHDLDPSRNSSYFS
jgi:hypothetical protein